MPRSEKKRKKSKKLALEIELIPASSWSNNLRSILKPKMWDEIRKKVYKKNNFKCAICKEKRKLQAHEVWKFLKRSKKQKLIDVIPLCYLCHMVKHIGYAQVSGGRILNERLIKHFMDVNQVERKEFQKHLKAAIKRFVDRSQYDWELDVNKLRDFEDEPGTLIPQK